MAKIKTPKCDYLIKIFRYLDTDDRKVVADAIEELVKKLNKNG